MASYNPRSTSTPKPNKPIQARRPIRSSQDILSPIENKKSGDELERANDSDSIEDRKEEPHSSFEEESDQNTTFDEIKSDNTNFGINYRISYFLLIIFALVIYFYNTGDDQNDFNCQQLQEKYSPQEKDFCINIKVAVNDVTQLNQPKSIIFLYNNETAMDNILESISKYASSKICDSAKPIIVHGSYLQNNEILEDYGTFITDIRNKLGNQCVVVIKNLEEVPGISAQAFHSLCDEYNPVEEHAIFLFTLKVDSFQEKSNTFVEKKLRALWKDLHNDKFYPLFTRISTFIVRVRPEK